MRRNIKLKGSHKTAILIFIFSVLWITSGVVFKSNGAIGEPAEEVSLYRVKVADLKSQFVNAELVIKGKTNADKKVTIKAETSGTISQIVKQEGERITSNDTLIKISSDDRPVKFDEAKALVQQRQLEYTAAKNLSQKGFNSQIRLAEALSQLNSAKASLKSAELDLQRTSIKAPFDGYLDKRYVEVGDYVSVGTEIATIVDLDPIKITAEIPENSFSAIAEGLPITATLIDGTVLEGEITFVSKIANETTRTYTVEMKSPNKDGFVAEGMTTEVKFSLAPVKAYKISPAILGLNDRGEVGIKTVDDNDVIQFHTVNIVKHDYDGMWISGLPDHIRLVVAGGDFVKENTKVIAINEDETNS
ncbi:MAG: efflux RND transporter periplasmic adaptor subunit [Alphaproteobacteria bacterium]